MDDQSLRETAELREVERQVASIRFRLSWLEYLAIPVMVVASVAMVLGLLLGLGSIGPVLGGAVSILGGAAGLVSLSRRQRANLAELEWRRRDLLGLEDDPRDSTGLLTRESRSEPPSGTT